MSERQAQRAKPIYLPSLCLPPTRSLQHVLLKGQQAKQAQQQAQQRHLARLAGRRLHPAAGAQRTGAAGCGSVGVHGFERQVA